jgi:stage V sporulation protein R
MTIDTALTPELRLWNDRIREWAAGVGLDFFPVIFELVDFDELNEVAAYGGFPTRYAHWTHGMQYEQLAKGYEWGQSKIYELVINNDPCYAYLMRGNEMFAQKMVMAHVYAHCDFFKNNAFFSRTNRKMMDETANHATRVRRYIDKHGLDAVEDFIDVCLSLDDLIDPFLPFTANGQRRPHPGEQKDETERVVVPRFDAKDYMDRYINPPETLEKERLRLIEQRRRQKRFPEHDEKDILLFLINYAPLPSWKRDVLEIVRNEAYYFAPQRQTKIMNEGWASYWHSHLMTTKIADASEIVSFAELHAGTMGAGSLNPYKLGLELFRDIERRWNTGRHGKAFEECDDIDRKRDWDTGEGKGREKIFEVRRMYNDATFIDEFLTPEFCMRNKLFVWEHQAAFRPVRAGVAAIRRHQGEVAVPVDELRAAVHCRARRQLSEPCRVVAVASARRRRHAHRLCPRRRCTTCRSSGAGRCICAPKSTANRSSCRTTVTSSAPARARPDRPRARPACPRPGLRTPRPQHAGARRGPARGLRHTACYSSGGSRVCAL